MSSRSHLQTMNASPVGHAASGAWRPCDRAEKLPVEILRASFADRRPGP